MRDDVLEAELHGRLGASQQALQHWFSSLRPAERERVVELMSAQIGHLEQQEGEGVVRKEQLERIRALFSAWMHQPSAS